MRSAIDPWFITGFTDAEGCFTLNVTRNKEYKTGWYIQAIFQIGLHQKDHVLLDQIKSSFGVGSINFKHGPQTIQYRIVSVKDLAIVISHFDKYPMITQKRADYELFKQAIQLMKQKEHLTEAGLAKIVAIKASMNNGLSPELKAAFPNILKVSRPIVEDQNIKDPHWLAGFTSGEGCFRISINQSKTKVGGSVQVQLVLKLTQHSRDEQLMRNLIEFLDCGNIYIYNEVVDLRITKFNDLTNKVLPFFNKYQILGVKSKDLKDFCKVTELMLNKAHLTGSGLDQIRKIKAGMNKGRLNEDGL